MTKLAFSISIMIKLVLIFIYQAIKQCIDTYIWYRKPHYTLASSKTMIEYFSLPLPPSLAFVLFICYLLFTFICYIYTYMLCYMRCKSLEILLERWIYSLEGCKSFIRDAHGLLEMQMLSVLHGRVHISYMHNLQCILRNVIICELMNV